MMRGKNMGKLINKINKLIKRKKERKEYKTGTKIGYLCEACENTGFIVLQDNKTMQCTRCGWRRKIP